MRRRAGYPAWLWVAVGFVTVSAAAFGLLILVLVTLVRSSPDMDLLLLKDNPAALRGKTIRVQCTFDDHMPPPYLGGRNFAFRVTAGSTWVYFSVYFPESDTPYPHLTNGDPVYLTFRCEEGETTRGNVLVSVRRVK